MAVYLGAARSAARSRSEMTRTRSAEAYLEEEEEDAADDADEADDAPLDGETAIGAEAREGEGDGDGSDGASTTATNVPRKAAAEKIATE